MNIEVVSLKAQPAQCVADLLILGVFERGALPAATAEVGNRPARRTQPFRVRDGATAHFGSTTNMRTAEGRRRLTSPVGAPTRGVAMISL